jgi:hypothetical protein
MTMPIKLEAHDANAFTDRRAHQPSLRFSLPVSFRQPGVHPRPRVGAHELRTAIGGPEAVEHKHNLLVRDRRS